MNRYKIAGICLFVIVAVLIVNLATSTGSWVQASSQGFSTISSTTAGQGRQTPTVFAAFPIVPHIPSPTPTATPTATATPPPGSSGDIRITYIFYNGAGSQEPDEYVEIRNYDSQSIQLWNWTLRDEANHVFTFPAYVIVPGQTCRVYTNQFHPEWCNFNYGNGAAIWNNTGDTAYLRNAGGVLIDQCQYSGGGTGSPC